MNPLRIFHSADWHIGKGLGNIDRTDDFRVFFRDLLAMIAERQPDVLLISGDVFDTSMPANSAQRLYYDFMRSLEGTSVRATIVTAGNHDSQRFLEAPRALLETLRCYVAGDTVERQTFVLRDDDGAPYLAVAAVPYLREGDVRRGTMDDTDTDRAQRFEAGVRAHYDAVHSLLMDELKGARVPLVAMGHLFVTGSKMKPNSDPVESDGSVYVGTLRNVTADAFGDTWDYVALGHIHHGQEVKAKVPMRYSGSPVALSYSHMTYHHHIVEVTFDETGAMSVEELPVKQPRHFVQVKGTLDELKAGIDQAGTTYVMPFVEATLTSDECLPDLSNELTTYGETHGVIVTAVRNEALAARYAQINEEAPDLSDLTPDAVFKAYLRENFDEEVAQARFDLFADLFHEIVNDVHIHRKPVNDDGSIPSVAHEATAQQKDQ
ncbi:MAG: exonuclease SbcCD subunit D C-terminal domain-containing protein [Sutterella wadsworthensis]|nr:exonuclease SbcCD subunit D C-terminal domain-containing protein [Sutterella wadsworthensis]